MNFCCKKVLPPVNDKGKIFRFHCVCLFLLTFLMLSMHPLRGQKTDDDKIQWLLQHFQDILQPDQHLIHGLRYYDLYPAAPGHPFLEPDEFRTGSVIINEREYTSVSLKYDICNQRVLLRYAVTIGGFSDLILINDPIRGFEIDGRVFRIYPLPKIGDQYCQVIGTHPLKCLYFWYKELVPLNNSLESYNQYTTQKRNSYLFMNDQILEFKGKREFLKCFPVTMQNSIRKYIKENRMVMRSVSDNEMKNLILFCRDLMENNLMEKQDNP